MPSISIEYTAAEKLALLNASEDCSEYQWGSVRRFFEERYPTLVNNVGNKSISLPWWAFISTRNALRQVLLLNNIKNIILSSDAKAYLLDAKNKAEEFQNLSRQIDSTEEEVNTNLRQIGFSRNLMPYQLRNVRHLVRLHAGATFSVPGSGKTTEALAYYFLTRASNDKLLVIAPKNAFVAWEDELPVCVPSYPFNFIRLTGGRQRIQDVLLGDPSAIIISYHQLPTVLNEVADYLSRNSTYLFIDESHRMKRGHDGVHGATILTLSHLPKSKLILSGTPMPNTITDIVPQFNFLYPEIHATPDNIIDKLQNVFVRTTKTELGLQPPVRVIHNVEMSHAQQRLYRVLTSEAARQLEGLSTHDRVRFRRFARCVQYMLQAASNPALLVTSSIAREPLFQEVLGEGLSNKILITCELARKWAKEGKKTIIWTSFVNTVEHIAGLLSDIGAHFIHGGVPTSDDYDALDTREIKIREFNNPTSNCMALVANPAACSEGISLHHVCHRAIYVDRNYNAAQYLQSEDRIHRIGLSPDTKTYVTILCSPGTIDESVDRRLQVKVAAMSNVLNDPDLSVRPLNLDEEDEFEGLDQSDIEDLRSMLRIVS